MKLAEVEPDRLREAISAAVRAGDVRRLVDLTEALEAEAHRWDPLPHQVPPDGDWYLWLLLGGRFAGKSATGAWWLNDHMLGPPCTRAVPGGHYGMIIGQTIGTAAEAAWSSPASIRRHCPEARLIASGVGGSKIVWPNGAEARLFGAHSPEDVEHIRGAGANKCSVWGDELAAWRYLSEAWEQITFAARGARHPKIVASTTPRPRPLIRQFLDHAAKPEPKTLLERIVVSRATSRDNPHIDPALVESLYAQRGHSALGRQELDAEMLDDVQGALWRVDQLEATRRDDLAYRPIGEVFDLLGIQRVRVGIDPSTWGPDTGDDPGTLGQGIETGIVVAGLDGRYPAHVYVFADASGRYAPEGWAQKSADEWERWRALDLVPERNLGAMVLSTLRLVAPQVPIYHDGKRPGVWAATGKRARAEPIAALSGDPSRPETWGEGRIHLVGRFPELEGQMTGWDARESWSPDRLDALVWAITALDPFGSSGVETSVASMASMRVLA